MPLVGPRFALLSHALSTESIGSRLNAEGAERTVTPSRTRTARTNKQQAYLIYLTSREILGASVTIDAVASVVDGVRMPLSLDSHVKVVPCAFRLNTSSTKTCSPVPRPQEPDQHAHSCSRFAPFPQDASQEVLQATPQASHGFRSLEAAAVAA